MNRWRGWAAFGAILMMVVGIFHIISGVFGLFNDQWIVLDYSGFSVVDVTGLAVWYIAIGAVLLLGGIGVVQGSGLGRVVGVVAASLAIVSQLLLLPIHPLWSVVLIVLYVMALVAFLRVKSPLEPDYQEEVLLMAEEPVAPIPPAGPVAEAAMAAPAVMAAPMAAPAEPAVAALAVAPVAAAAAITEEQPAPRAYDLAEIEGIGPIYAEKLGGLGLKTTSDLLKVGASPKGREDLAFASGISGKWILRWVNMADLFRIKGLGEEYTDLLEAAGVDSVPELAQRRADNLTARMAEVNEHQETRAQASHRGPGGRVDRDRQGPTSGGDLLELDQVELCAPDDVVLQALVQLHEVGAEAGDTNHEVLVGFRMELRIFRVSALAMLNCNSMPSRAK